LECIAKEIEKTPCRLVTNQTCVCNERDFYKRVETCAVADCTPIDGIAAQKAKADFCNDPIRSQVSFLYALRSFEVAAWLLVIFRFYARWITQHSFGWDDYIMMIVALFYVQEPLYFTQLALTKMSILFLYLRIFPGRRFRILTYTFMSFVAGSTAVLVSLSIFECWPVGYFWEAWNTEYLIHSNKCLNLTLGAFGSASLSIFQDIVMIALPIPPLLKTHLPKKDKVAISSLFFLGLLITAASCVRLQFINVAYSPNPFWDYEPALLWSLVELAISFLVTSLPALYTYYNSIARPRVVAYFKTRRDRKTSQQSDSGEQSYLPSRLPSGPESLGQNHRRSGMISRLAFSPVSWDQVGDCASSHRLGDLQSNTEEIFAVSQFDSEVVSTESSKIEPTKFGDDIPQPNIHYSCEEDKLDDIEALAWLGRRERLASEAAAVRLDAEARRIS
ncbi:hypothetical protein BDP55DRAFT_568778, partial [Colletotrichum godetiae]